MSANATGDGERRLRWSFVVVGLAMLATSAVLVWHFVLDDAYWTPPPRPELHGWGSFAVYDWAALLLPLLMMIGAAVLAVRAWAFGGRGATRGLLVLLIAATLIGA